MPESTAAGRVDMARGLRGPRGPRLRRGTGREPPQGLL